MRWALNLKWTQVWQRYLVYSSGYSPTTTPVGTQGSELFVTFYQASQRRGDGNGQWAMGEMHRGQSGKSAWAQLSWWVAQVAVHTAATPGKLPNCPNHRAWEPSWHGHALIQEPFDCPFAKHMCVGGRGGSCVVPLLFLPSFPTSPRTFEPLGQL